MKKYLILMGLCLTACNPTPPPQGWDIAIAERWADAAKLDYTAIVCNQLWDDHSQCTVNTGTQLVNLYCYYRATPYCLPEYR